MTLFRVLAFSAVVLLSYTLFANILPQMQSNPPEEEEILPAGSMNMPAMVALGERLFSGRGTCTLCHNNMGRAPDLLNEDLGSLFAKHMMAENYQGAAKGKEGPKALEAYLHESLVDPSAFVVPGYGKKGTDDKVSPMPRVDAPPIELSEVEMNALIAFMQDRAGMTPTVPLPVQGDTIAEEEASAEEAAPAATPQEAIGKFMCNACHDLEGSAADAGPHLNGIGKRMDRAALRHAILDPNAEIAKGFDADMMPADFGEQMRVSELEMIIDYLMALPEAGGAQ